MGRKSLNYEEAGEGLPLVLVHGFPFDRTIWHKQLAGLRDVAHVLAIDVPGFGGSAPLEGDASMAGYADAIAEWAEELGLEKLVLAGHSMGGYIALAFARRHADMLAGLALICTKPGADTEEARQNRYKQADQVKREGPQATVDAMHAKLLAPDNYERKPEVAGRLRDTMLRQTEEGIVAALHAMAGRPDSTGLLDDIRVPVLVIAGAEDKIIPPSEGEAMAERIPNAHYRAIEGAAHMPMMEKANAVNDALAEFVGEVTSDE